MKDEHGVSRRGFLTVIGAGAAGLAVLASGCRKGGGSNLVCTDVSKLSEAEKAARTSLKYVDKSTEAGKSCSNCQLYKPAAQATVCGACTVLKGPINPAGHCASWAKKVKAA